jgi:hypothetical protein
MKLAYRTARRGIVALCGRDGNCPRFARLQGHNHLSEVLAFNFIGRGR